MPATITIENKISKLLSIKPQIEPIPDFQTIEEIKQYLSKGCNRCSLGQQEGINGCVIGRGNPDSRRVLLGEAPGRDENISGRAFSGPAGKLLDEIFTSIDMDTNKDWYICNTVMCRPIAPKGSGRENLTPKDKQTDMCFPFLRAQIKIIRPKIIVLLGKTAISNILPDLKNERMSDLSGRAEKINDIYYYCLYHPSAILHSIKRGKEYQDELKCRVWEDVRKLKSLIIEEDL